MSAHKTERLLNLVICLLSTRQFLSKEQIRSAVPQYAECRTDEAFGAGTDYWPLLFGKWDKEIAAHPFTGIAANDSHKNQTFNGVTFDPYEVSFRSVRARARRLIIRERTS